MSTETHYVETIDELNEQDWEVPGIDNEVPSLDWDATTEEIQENDDFREAVIQSVIDAFESYNGVTLEGEARKYFLIVMDDYYSC